MRRPPLTVVLPLVGAFALAGCGAGTKGPQYEEHTSSDFLTTTLPNGIALGGGLLTTTAGQGGRAVAVFTVGVLTGAGDTLTGVSSPQASSATLGLLSPQGRATRVESIQIRPTSSQVPVRVVVALSGLTTAFGPASSHPITLNFAGVAQPVTLQFPLARAGSLPAGDVLPTTIPDDPGPVAADSDNTGAEQQQ